MNIDKLSTKEKKARALFKSGYNCAQSVFCAYCEDLGLDFDTGLKLSSSFGGGMGKLREVCGAVSAMFMIAGLKKGYTSNNDDEVKTVHYKLIQDLANEFKQENGSIICRELLGIESDGYIPAKRTEAYYKQRPCEELVACATKVIDKIIK